MNILIIDDDVISLNRIKNDLFIYFSNENDKVNYYTYSKDFLSIDYECKYDFGFIDIELLTDDGIEIVKRLKRVQPTIQIIFVSSYQNLVHDSLIVQPLYFIRKTNYEEDMKKFFSLLNQLEKNSEYIGLNYKEQRYKILVRDILYISSLRHELTVVTMNDKYKDNRELKTIESILPERFVRIHKSYIVNLDYVKSYKSNEICLTDGTLLTLGRVYKKSFDMAYKKYLL